MHFIETNIQDLLKIEPVIHRDQRGYFLESFHLEKLQSAGIKGPFIQDNQSFSSKGVLRGLHYQNPPYQQGKLVSVAIGKVLDIVVDIRKQSPTFGNHYSCILDAEKHNILYVPEGMAHGFLALENSLFVYKCTEFYNKESEGGIRWNDPDLEIDWGVPNPIVSEKDSQLPYFNEVMKKL